MYQFVKITKRCRTENAIAEPGDWDSYRIGQADNEKSLPVDYVLIGFMDKPLAVGEVCKVLRVERNGIVAIGVFQSTAIQQVFAGGFATRNSVYLVEPMDLASYLAG